jgi:hypothetical protein
MGDSKRRKNRFFAEHPRCCFCGGDNEATTEDHQPARGLFDGRRWYATGRTLGRQGKTQSRQLAVTPQKPVDWGAVVGKVSIALKEKRSEARAAAWARTMEKLRSRQMALNERAATVDAYDTACEGSQRDHHQGLMRAEGSQGA